MLFNGELQDPDESLVPAVSEAVLYGRGVFTTVRITPGGLFEWNRHVARLKSDSKSIGMRVRDGLDLPAPDDILGLASLNGVREGKARVSIFDASSSSRWSGDSRSSIAVLVQAQSLVRTEELLSITDSPFTVNERSPLASVKSCNYLQPVLAIQESNLRGFDEAVRCNSAGVVAGCCYSNIFWISSETGALRTPSLATGCLPGTTRSYVLEAFDVDEVIVPYKQFVDDAESAFVTSSVKGVSVVARIGAKKMLDRLPEEIEEFRIRSGLYPLADKTSS